MKALQETSREFNPSLWSYHVAWTLLHLGRMEEAHSIVEDFFRTELQDRGGVVTGVRALVHVTKGDGRGAETSRRS